MTFGMAWNGNGLWNQQLDLEKKVARIQGTIELVEI